MNNSDTEVDEILGTMGTVVKLTVSALESRGCSKKDILKAICGGDPCFADCEVCGERIQISAYGQHLKECKARLAAMPEIDLALLEEKVVEMP